MIYRGYEIKQTHTVFSKDGNLLSINGWGIFANGDFQGSVVTLKEAKDYVDEVTKDVLYRPRRHRAYKKSKYEKYKEIMEGNGHDKNRSDT